MRRSIPTDPGYVLKRGEDFNRDILPIRCKAKYEQLIGRIRAVARALGYAIGVHGSLSRDIDLIAVPWSDDAVSHETLALAIEGAVEGIISSGIAGAERLPVAKPHGRRAWSIHLGGGPYIDLSITPRTVDIDAARIAAKVE